MARSTDQISFLLLVLTPLLDARIRSREAEMENHVSGCAKTGLFNEWRYVVSYRDENTRAKPLIANSNTEMPPDTSGKR